MGHAPKATLQELFKHPVSHNLRWDQVLHLLEVAGAETRQTSNGHVLVKLGDQSLTLTHVQGKHVEDAHTVLTIRRLLEAAGITAETGLPGGDAADTGTTGEASDGPSRLVITIDHHEAKIYRLGLGAPETRRVRPHDSLGFLRHLQKKQTASVFPGQRAPEETGFYEEVIEAIADADEIIVFGHGKGHSDARMHLLKALAKSRPALLDRVRSVETIGAIHEPALLERANAIFVERAEAEEASSAVGA